MTHADLVARAVRWLHNSERCQVVIHEWVATMCSEQPDALGWKTGGRDSVLIECKTSVSDFYADRRKLFRKLGEGAGRRRYYMTPPGLLRPEQLPPGWGLLEAHGKIVRRIVESPGATDFTHCRHDCELLFSALKRALHDPHMLVYRAKLSFLVEDESEPAQESA